MNRSPRIAPDLPEGWRLLLEAMTALDPSERPDAAEVARRLRDLTASTPIAEAADPGVTRLLTQPIATPANSVPVGLRDASTRLADRSLETIRRSPRVSAGAALIILLTVVVVVLIAVVRTPERDDIPSQTPQPLEEPLRELHHAVNGK